MATDDRLPTGDGDQQTTYWSHNGVARWSCVDDPIGAPDDATSYCQTNSTSEHYLLFTFSAFTVPAGSSVEKITIFMRHKGGAENRSALKVNGTRYLTTQSAISVGSSYEDSTQDWTTNPDTSAAWTVDDINGSGSNPLQQFGVYGMKAAATLYVTQVYATVTYTTPAIQSAGGSGGCSTVSATVSGSWAS